MSGYQDTANRASAGKELARRSPSTVQKAAQRAVATRGPSKAWRVGAGIRRAAGPIGVAAAATEAGYLVGKHVEKKETAKGNVKAAVDTKGGNGGYPKPVWVKGAPKKYGSGGPPTQERSFKNKYGKTETQTYETSGKRNYEDYQNDKKNKLGLQAKTAANQDSETIENYRNYRKANNQYKGKYYGPDVFKGNMSVLKAWRKAGSPKDVKAFAKSQKG